MKVLIIGPFSPPVNGVSFANDTLLRNIRAVNVVCDAINTNTGKVSSRQGTDFSSRKAFGFLHTYRYLYKIFRCDLAYLTPGQTFFGIIKYAPFMLTCLLLRKPYVIHVHGNYLGTAYRNLKGMKKKLFHFLLSHAKAGIVLSQSLTGNFTGLLEPERIFIVYNFVDNSLYDTAPAPKRKDKARMLYLSNLMREKGILEFLDALIELHRKNVDFKATFAGIIEEDISDEIGQRFKKIGNKVEYIGTVTGNSKKQAFLDANIFILPTYYPMEGQPISLLEGLATGNIIVTTNHAGIPDVVNETNGFLIESRSSAAIEECLMRISGRLGEYIDKYAFHNVNYACTNFTEERFSNHILHIFQQVVNGKPSTSGLTHNH